MDYSFVSIIRVKDCRVEIRTRAFYGSLHTFPLSLNIDRLFTTNDMAVRVRAIVEFVLGLLLSVVGKILSFCRGVSQILSEIRLSN